MKPLKTTAVLLLTTDLKIEVFQFIRYETGRGIQIDLNNL